MIKIAVTGACGKMGGLIIENVLKSKEMKLVSAIDVTNIGKDIGEVMRTGKLGVPVTDANDIENVLKISKPDARSLRGARAACRSPKRAGRGPGLGFCEQHRSRAARRGIRGLDRCIVD